MIQSMIKRKNTNERCWPVVLFDFRIFSDSMGVKIFFGNLTCHSRPRIRCGTPAAISSWRMLTILHPSARAEFNPRIRFSAFLKIFKFPLSFGCLFNTRSSTVPGFAQFIANFFYYYSENFFNLYYERSIFGRFSTFSILTFFLILKQVVF